MAPARHPPDLANIVVVGGINIDYVGVSERLPREGEILRASSFEYSAGGKGHNYAVACARLLQNRPRPDEHEKTMLGVPTGQNPLAIAVKLIASVGADHWGPELIRGLEAQGVDCKAVKTKKGVDTGLVMIFIDSNTGQNRLLSWPAANYAFERTDIPFMTTPLPQVVYVNLEIPLSTALHAMRLAKAAGARVMFNPSPMVKETLPAEMYTLVTDIVMNEEEVEKLLGAEAGVSIRDDLVEVAKSFLKKGVKTAIITLGQDGYFYATDHGKEYGSEKGLEVQAVDVTSAGDTFLAAYAIATMHGASIRAACSWGNKCAAVTVQRPNAGVSQPWRDEVPDFLEAG